MATIVRVKRRRDEDPLDVLLLTHKRPKIQKGIIGEKKKIDDANIFKFAGTVTSKDAQISTHVKEAIRKDKLAKSYRQHQSAVVGDLRQQNRQCVVQCSEHNRYKVTSKYRAADLDKLDDVLLTVAEESADTKQVDDSKQSIPGTKQQASVTKHELTDQTLPTCTCCSGKVNNADSDRISTVSEENRKESCHCPSDCTASKLNTINKSDSLQSVCLECGKPVLHSGRKRVEAACNSKQLSATESVASSNCTSIARENDGNNSCTSTGQDLLKCSHQDGSTSTADSSNKQMFCLVDMEVERESTFESALWSSASDRITCNSQPMIREMLFNQNDEQDFVYDIYYTNQRDFDFHMFEKDLTFEAFGSEICESYVENADDEFVYGDEDDENAENNWRNDYPECDPQLLEIVGAQEDHDDMDEYTAFETETGDQLADWVKWRCNLEGRQELCSDDDDDNEAPFEHYDPTTPYGYYKCIQRELNGDESSEGSELDIVDDFS